MDFTTIDYLKNGGPKQQKVYAVLIESNIFKDLEEFNPVLIGTFPIGIDIATSDLDIACQWQDSKHFINKLYESFSGYENFILSELEIDKQSTILANFTLFDFEFEIFGQNIPVKAQLGYRHMIIESKILEERGEAFREKIIELKNQGFKTEPAFAHLLRLSGNPYIELLKYE